MAVPFTITKKYEITPSQTVFTTRPSILMQLISRSNKTASNSFINISSPETLYEYYPDEKPHITLEKARNLVEAGYDIYVQNVYTAKSPINIRVLDYNDNELLTIPYTSGTESSSSFELNNFENSVIKVDIRHAQPKDYLVLETKSPDDGVQNNVLIWFHDKTQNEIDNFEDAAGNKGESFFIQDYLGISTQYINFHTGNGISLIEGSRNVSFINIVNKCPLYFFCSNGTTSTEFYIASNRSFINLGNHTPNIDISISDTYVQTIINKTKIDNKIIDFYSLYNTDNDEIALNIENINSDISKIDVLQIYKNKILKSESYIGTTTSKTNPNYEPLVDQINNNSSLIGCTSYVDNITLPEGTILLTKNEEISNFDNTIEEKEIKLFINGLSNIEDDDKEKVYCYYDSNFNSLNYQKELYDLFKDSLTLGFFTYRGIPVADDPKNIAYFSDQKFYIGSKEYNTSDGCLSMMITTSFVSGPLLGAFMASETNFKDSFINYVHPETIITSRQLRGYFDGQLKDLRYCMIRPIIMKELTSSWDNSITSIMTAINKVKDIFTQLFNTDLEIYLEDFSTINNEITAKVTYYIAGIEDIDTLDLVLKVSIS